MKRVGAEALFGALSVVAATACGGSAQRDGEAAGQGGSAATAGTLGNSGGAGTSGGASAKGGSGGAAGLPQAGAPSSGGAAGEPAWTFERPICGGSLEPNNNQAFCGGPITIAPPVITDTDGDQAVTAGDLLQLRIVTSNETDSSLGYPCLGLAVEGQAALLPLSPAGDALENPIFSGSYALVSGSSVEYEFYARIADSVAPGTTIRFLAWNDALHSQCENSGELEFQIEIE